MFGQLSEGLSPTPRSKSVRCLVATTSNFKDFTFGAYRTEKLKLNEFVNRVAVYVRSSWIAFWAK